MKRSDFTFHLPDELIARYPLADRSDSRLLVANPNTQEIIDTSFKALARDRSPESQFFEPGDLLVFNDSRVIPARIYAQKPSGGKVEILVERVLPNEQALVHLGSNKPIKIDQKLILPDQSEATVIDRKDRFFILQFSDDQSLLTRLKNIGHMPLPHYLRREDETLDQQRYQTVYARLDGSVAAPTAGLHFDETMMETLAKNGIQKTFVTLHVGAGTFTPVRTENIEEHTMHYEWAEISAETVHAIQETKARGNSVIAVGTTSMRCLETAALSGELKPFSGETNIFITPGFELQVADALITNFHFPESTLLMLVSAFIGVDFMHEVYRHAIKEKYRFYSYGDSSLLFRKSHAPNPKH